MQRTLLVVSVAGLAAVVAVVAPRWIRRAEEPPRLNRQDPADQMRDLAAILRTQGKGHVARQLLDDAAALGRPEEQPAAGASASDSAILLPPIGADDDASGQLPHDPTLPDVHGPVFFQWPGTAESDPPLPGETASLRREVAELREQLQRLREENEQMRRRIESLAASLSRGGDALR